MKRNFKTSLLYAAILAATAQPAFSVESYNLPSGQWRLISLPANPGVNNTVNDIFGDDISPNIEYKKDWVVYSYDPTEDRYAAKELYDSLEPGYGYWIIQNSGKLVQLDMPANSTSAAMIIPLTPPDQGEAQQWNLAGYPSTVSAKLNDFKVKTSTGECADGGCNLDEAERQKILHNKLWRFSKDGANQYEEVSNGDNLSPWDGFWCVTLENASQVSPLKLTLSQSPLPPVSGNWKLEWADDFNGYSLDAGKWRVGGHHMDIAGKAGNSPKQIKVRNGKLELVAEKKKLRFSGKDYQYSTGEVSTFKKYRQKYGYFEARIKYDAVKGVWPAFWTMPDRGDYGNNNLRRQSYLEFDLGTINQPITSAELRLNVKDYEEFKDNNQASNITIHKLLSNNWNESTINWLNKPDHDPLWIKQFIGTNGANPARANEIIRGQDIVIDVTEYINEQRNGNKKAGFALLDTFRRDQGITFGSKESQDANDRPRLVIDGSNIPLTKDAYVMDGQHHETNFGNKSELGVKEPWTETSTTYNGGMEIDIMESLGVWGDNKTQHALHWDYLPLENHPKKEFARQSLNPSADGYHVYGMYWEPGRIVFYIDGQKTEEYKNDRVASVASYILLSNQLGGWGENTNIRGDLLPATMYIDYVRVWSGTADK
jgi:beta-glucanase (GH16 family)